MYYTGGPRILFTRIALNVNYIHSGARRGGGRASSSCEGKGRGCSTENILPL